MKYHLTKALKESDSLDNFNLNITQRATRGGFNSPTKELIEKLVDDISNAKNEVIREAREESENHLLRENIKEKLSPLINQPIINKSTQEVATLTNNGIRKMISERALQKSVDNGFSKEEHFRAVEQVNILFENATKASSKTDIQDNNLTIHRYNAPFKDSNALLTIKEYKENGKKIYSLELEELNAIKFNPSGKDLMEQSPKSKDADTTTVQAP
ncbi:MAG: hypothetical protein K2I71_00140, partial [Helicobacter sp.]|nr:hypothetical protein [Helicobacter sp.]